MTSAWWPSPSSRSSAGSTATPSSRTDRPPDTRRLTDELVAALNARDFERLERVFPWDPEFEFRSALAVSEGEVYRGIDGLRAWARNADATWASFHVEIEEFHDAGDDRNVVVLHVTGTARASGIPLDMRTGQVWTWRGGLIWRNESFTDPREAFRVAGLER